MSNEINFEKLIQRHHHGLQRIAACYEANESLRHELLQDIMEAIWVSLKNFRQEASIKTYIFRIAYFRCARHVDKQMKRIETTIDSEVSAVYEQLPEDVVAQQRQTQQLIDAVRQLPLIQKQLITLVFEGFSYQEMSEMTGLKTNHVGVVLNRAKKSLKQIMGKNHER